MVEDIKAVFLDAETLGADADLSPLQSVVPQLNIYDQTSPKDIVARAKSADIIITNKAALTAGVIAALPNLKLICLTATGTDNVDLTAAASHGIVVKNVANYSTHSVAQQVMAFMFALTTNLINYSDWSKAGNWQSSQCFNYLGHPIVELAQKTLGLIGYGNIAKQVETIALAIGMRVMIAERPNAVHIRDGRHSFESVISTADVISLHCPLTPETKGMINASLIDQMKDDVILINTARGAIIDEAVLADAMNKGKFYGVGLDVLSIEPPTPDNPLLQITHNNFIITPHIAWASDQARRILVNRVANNIKEYLSA